MISLFKVVLKKLIFAFCSLYAISLVLTLLNIHIPINLFSLSVSSILGFPGIISVIMIYVFLL